MTSAINRAILLFNNKEKYEICRINAYNSTIDVLDVAKQWCNEFYRIKDKIYFDIKVIQQNSLHLNLRDLSELNNFNTRDYIFVIDKENVTYTKTDYRRY